MISDQPYKQRMALGQQGNTLVMLIATCLVLFVGLAFLKAVWFFRFPKEVASTLYERNVMSLFSFPADGGHFFHRPWTVLSYMFVHDNIWKVCSNMLWLWCFGYIMQDLTGNRKILPVFIYICPVKVKIYENYKTGLRCDIFYNAYSNILYNKFLHERENYR